MAHPHLLARPHGPDAVEQRAVGRDIDPGAAELALVSRFDLAAELGAQRLLAVADAEDGQAGGKHGVGDARAVGSVTEAGPPERITPWGRRS